MKLRYLFYTLLIFTVSCNKSLTNSVNFNTLDNITENITVRSENIVSHLKTLPYVEGAQVTIMGDNALVALDLTNNFNDGDIIRIKTAVRNETRNCDSSIKKVTVSVMPQLIDKATDFAGEQKSGGHEISDKLEEISVPTVPTL